MINIDVDIHVARHAKTADQLLFLCNLKHSIGRKYAG
jgi:hypothetical protein